MTHFHPGRLRVMEASLVSILRTYGGRNHPRCVAHTEHRFLAPSLKEGCRKPVLGVWLCCSLRLSKWAELSWIRVSSRFPTTSQRLKVGEHEKVSRTKNWAMYNVLCLLDAKEPLLNSFYPIEMNRTNKV